MNRDPGQGGADERGNAKGDEDFEGALFVEGDEFSAKAFTGAAQEFGVVGKGCAVFATAAAPERAADDE